jgi:hypothetical protein
MMAYSASSQNKKERITELEEKLDSLVAKADSSNMIYSKKLTSLSDALEIEIERVSRIQSEHVQYSLNAAREIELLKKETDSLKKKVKILTQEIELVNPFKVPIQIDTTIRDFLKLCYWGKNPICLLMNNAPEMKKFVLSDMSPGFYSNPGAACIFRTPRDLEGGCEFPQVVKTYDDLSAANLKTYFNVRPNEIEGHCEPTPGPDGIYINSNPTLPTPYGFDGQTVSRNIPEKYYTAERISAEIWHNKSWVITIYFIKIYDRIWLDSFYSCDCSG